MTGFKVKIQNLDNNKKTTHFLEVEDGLIEANSPNDYVYKLWGMAGVMASNMCQANETIVSIKKLYS